MNISGVVIRARPEDAQPVRARLLALPGVELHADGGDGRLVVTLEDCSAATAAETYASLHYLPGVLSVAMVYQYSDDIITEDIER